MRPGATTASTPAAATATPKKTEEKPAEEETPAVEEKPAVEEATEEVPASQV